MPFSFLCSPVIRECSWNKTQIEKKIWIVYMSHDHVWLLGDNFEIGSNSSYWLNFPYWDDSAHIFWIYGDIQLHHLRFLNQFYQTEIKIFIMCYTKVNNQDLLFKQYPPTLLLKRALCRKWSFASFLMTWKKPLKIR